MPATRSWAHIDLTAEGLEFAPIDKDPWLPFLRVTNSYNRSRALGFTVGVCRSICTNGMIFGEQSLKLKVTHATDVDLDHCVVDAFAHRRFDVAGCRDKLGKLTRPVVAGGTVPGGDTGDPRGEAAGGASSERRAPGRVAALRILPARSGAKGTKRNSAPRRTRWSTPQQSTRATRTRLS